MLSRRLDFYLFLTMLAAGFVKNPLRLLFPGIIGTLVTALPDALMVFLLGRSLYWDIAHYRKATTPREWGYPFALIFWVACFIPVLAVQFEKTADLGEAFVTTRYFYCLPIYLYLAWSCLARAQFSSVKIRNIVGWVLKANLVYVVFEGLSFNFVPPILGKYLAWFYPTYRPITIFGRWIKASGPSMGAQDASILCAVSIVFFLHWFEGRRWTESKFWLGMAVLGWLCSFTTTSLICLVAGISISALVKKSRWHRYRFAVFILIPLGALLIPLILHLKWQWSDQDSLMMQEYYVNLLTETVTHTARILAEYPNGIGPLSVTGDNNLYQSLRSSDIYFVVAVFTGGWIVLALLLGFPAVVCRRVFARLRNTGVSEEVLIYFLMSSIIFLSAMHYNTLIQAGYAQLFALCTALAVSTFKGEDYENLGHRRPL